MAFPRNEFFDPCNLTDKAAMLQAVVDIATSTKQWRDRIGSMWRRGNDVGALRMLRNNGGPDLLAHRDFTAANVTAELARIRELLDSIETPPSMPSAVEVKPARLPALATFSAIQTLRGPGGNYTATCIAGNEPRRLGMVRDFALSDEESHKKCARLLLERIGVDFKLVSAFEQNYPASWIHIAVER